MNDDKPQPTGVKRYEDPALHELAADLQQRFPEELKAAPLFHTVAFVRDDEAEPTERGEPVLALVRKIPAYCQVLTDCREFLIEVFTLNISHLDERQKAILMFEQLLRFEGDGEIGAVKLRQPDLKGWKLVIGTLGTGWAGAHRSVPDILSADFKWTRREQIRLETDSVGKVVPFPGQSRDQAAAGAAPV